jgi:hypothetical protein
MVAHATGDAVVVLRSAMKLAPGYLLRALKMLAAYPNLWAVTGWVREGGALRAQRLSFDGDPPWLLAAIQADLSGAVMRRSVLQERLPAIRDLPGRDDYRLLVGMAAAGLAAGCIPETCVEIEGGKPLPPGLADALAVEHAIRRWPDLYRSHSTALTALLASRGERPLAPWRP